MFDIRYVVKVLVPNGELAVRLVLDGAVDEVMADIVAATGPLPVDALVVVDDGEEEVLFIPRTDGAILTLL